MLFEPSESLEFLIVIRLAIEPAINDSPGARREIHQREIASSHELVNWSIGFGEKIPQFHLGSVRRDAGQSIAHSARGAVVAFSETSGQNQYSLFHNSLSRYETKAQERTEVYSRRHSEFNGYLRQAK